MVSNNAATNSSFSRLLLLFPSSVIEYIHFWEERENNEPYELDLKPLANDICELRMSNKERILRNSMVPEQDWNLAYL